MPMTTTDYRPQIENMVWSYSRITSFDQCRYCWFLRYIQHLEPKPKFYSDYGSFVHKLLEQYYNGEATKEELPMKFLFGFQNEVGGDRPPISTVEKYIQLGLEYFKTFEPVPYKVIGVEKQVSFEVAGYKFTGYIDLLCEDDGEFIIIDNKSRDLKPRTKRKYPTENDKLLDKMLRQLYLYSKGVKEEYGKFPKKLCFNCFKAGTFIEEDFNEDAYNAALKWAQESIEDIIESDNFRPNIDFFFCNNLCGFGDECCYCDSEKNKYKRKRKRG